MLPPQSPPDEAARLEALLDSGLLDTPAEERFDRITRLARAHFGVSICLVSLIDKNRQWFKSRCGLDVPETSREISFCGHAILGDDIFEVPDATADERFADNPLVTGAPHIRFYAGAPLHGPNGFKFGTLCIIDTQPRTLSPTERAALCDYAAMVEQEINDLRAEQLRKELGASQKRSQALLSAFPDMVFVISRQGRFVECLDHPDLPRPRAEVLGRHVGEVLPSTLGSQMCWHLNKVFRDRIDSQLEYQLAFPDGVRHFEARLILLDENEALVIARNVTADRANAAELKRLSEVVRQTTNGVMITDPNGKIVWLNEAFTGITGYSLEEIGGKRPGDVLQGPDTDPAVVSHMREALRRLQPFDVEVLNYNKERQPYWVRISCSPMRDERGSLQGFIAIETDITRDKEKQAQLDRSTQLLSAVASANGIGIWQWNVKDHTLEVNDQWLELLGYQREEIGVVDFPTWERLTHPEDVQRCWNRLRRHFSGELDFYDEDIRMRRKDGRWVWINTRGSLVSMAEDDSPGVMLGTHIDVTERRSLERQLAAEQRLLSEVLQTSVSAITVLDEDGRIVFANEAATRILSCDQQSVVGRLYACPTRRLSDLEGRRLDPHALPHALLANGRQTISDLLHTVEFSDGRRRFVSVNGACLDPEPGEGRRFVLSISDITEQVETARALAESSEQMQAIVDNILDAIVTIDTHGLIESFNPAAEKMFGYSAQDVLGKNVSMLMPEPFSLHHDEYLQNYLQTGEAKVIGRGRELQGMRSGGAVFPLELRISEIARGGTLSFVGMFRDITDRKIAEEQINRLTFYDPLTGLPNRRLLFDRLGQALAGLARKGDLAALLFIDLNNFKTLNDSAGHDKGDELLKQVAQRLSECVRGGDTVARIGGDEFVILVQDLNSDQVEAVAQAEIVAEKVQAKLNKPFSLDGLEHYTSGSIGVTLVDRKTSSLDMLLKQSDLAMYEAKSSGTNSIRFFDPAMQVEVERRARLEADLRRAMRNRELIPYFQVQVDTVGRPVGAEILLRWEHPDLGVISPATFIPLAEATGLIVPIGFDVFEAACACLVRWSKSSKTAQLNLSVNVSVEQFRNDMMVKRFAEILRQTGADPARLKLEITESVLAEDIAGVVGKLNALKQLGLKISLDDFGTGYSSLSYLKNLPLDQIKIDQSFVRDLAKSPKDAAIAQSVIAVAKAIGLEVVAEGVETEEQRKLLDGIGCGCFQGYLFGRPMRLSELESVL